MQSRCAPTVTAIIAVSLFGLLASIRSWLLFLHPASNTLEHEFLTVLGGVGNPHTFVWHGSELAIALTHLAISGGIPKGSFPDLFLHFVERITVCTF